MSFVKSAAVATLVTVTALGASMTAATAHGKKIKFGHHHHSARDFAYGALVGAAVVGAVNYDCKKWKYRYQRTGNPAFLDRYYACKY